MVSSDMPESSRGNHYNKKERLLAAQTANQVWMAQWERNVLGATVGNQRSDRTCPRRRMSAPGARGLPGVCRMSLA